MRDSLLFLAFLQLFFGFIHFYSTAMFHVASNVILDSMLWWWKWFLITEIFWIASKTFFLGFPPKKHMGFVYPNFQNFFVVKILDFFSKGNALTGGQGKFRVCVCWGKKVFRSKKKGFISIIHSR